VRDLHWLEVLADEAAAREVVDDEMAAVLVAMSGAERLRVAAGMFRAARRMLESHLRELHPTWSADELALEVGRRLSHGAG
jgi:hypothetical protein